MLRGCAALAAVALLGLAWGTSGTQAGWSGAGVANTASTAATGGVAITHTYAGSCAGAVRVASVACPSTLTPTSGAPATSSDAITNNSGRTVTQSLTAASCGPVRLLNDQQAADPMLPRYGVAFRQTDKWGTTSAAAFSGQGYATDIVGTTGNGLLGLLSSSYSIGVWFNAADSLGGGLMSLSGSLSNGSGAANPALWLDGSGHVGYSVSSTLGSSTQTSTAAYATGWHLAVLTVSKPLIGLTEDMTLYVDGAVQASSTALALLTSTSGYWHLGWSSGSSTFHGSLSGAFVNQSTALSAATVSSLYGAATATAYRTAVAAQSGAASVWMLGDDGVTTYAGTVPFGSATPCAQVNVTLTFTGPAATVGPVTLDALVTGGSRTVAAPAAGATQSLSIATSRGASYNTDIGGLRLYVPMTFAYGTSPATSWTQSLAWAGDARQVFVA